jgi:hypothetical protein
VPFVTLLFEKFIARRHSSSNSDGRMLSVIVITSSNSDGRVITSSNSDGRMFSVLNSVLSSVLSSVLNSVLNSVLKTEIEVLAKDSNFVKRHYLKFGK